MQNYILRCLDTSDDAWPPGRRYGAEGEHVSACLSETRIFTSGPMGGDASHGGFVCIDIADQACSDWHVAVATNQPVVTRETKGWPRPLEEHCISVRRLRFVARGDAECENLLAALKMAVETLERAGYVATPGDYAEGEDKDLLPVDPRTAAELLAGREGKVYTRPAAPAKV